MSSVYHPSEEGGGGCKSHILKVVFNGIYHICIPKYNLYSRKEAT